MNNRTRTDPSAIIRYGLYLYFSSMSLRLAAARCLSSVIIKRSHVSIWKWVQKYSDLTDRFRVNKRAIKEIYSLMKHTAPDRWSGLLVRDSI